jgi:hypothetical protein
MNDTNEVPLGKQRVFPQTLAVEGLLQTFGGLTKRELFAVMILSFGNQSASLMGGGSYMSPEFAVERADGLIKALGRTGR